MKFIHTADWQLGKPFAGIADAHKRSLVQQERLAVIKRIGAVAEKVQAEFVVMAGDLFDSNRADNATVSAACSAIGGLKIPVLVIPGNHDHGGPGSVWQQDFFLREQAALAPNLRVLLKPEPVEMGGAQIYPCPLLRRAELTDPTEWLRNPEVFAGEGPRIVLAHGSTQGFTSQDDGDEESGGGATNFIDLSRLPMDEIDYVALGDWHGTKEVHAKAWFAGTPETDRFPKGAGNQPGHILVVEVQRGAAPMIEPVATARLQWLDQTFEFTDDASVDQLQNHLNELLGQRAGEDLLLLHLSGALGMAASTRLEQMIESLEARLLRLKLRNQTGIAPTPEEIEALTQRVGDPLISAVASTLFAQRAAAGDTPEGAVLATALRELYAACGGAA